MAWASAASAVATGSSCENSREKLAEALGIADHAGVGEQAFEFLAAFGERFEFAAQAGDHGAVGVAVDRLRGDARRRCFAPASQRREQLVGGARQFGVAAQRGFAQRGGRRVQQAVGQRVREQVEHFLRVAAGGELLRAPWPALRRASASPCARRRLSGAWRVLACKVST